MSEMPWVRFFPSDWLCGTRGMSAAETGIYITLVATMYERGEPIPEDHSRLARLCGSPTSRFSDALETLIYGGKILRTEAGLWNERVEKENSLRSEKRNMAQQSANTRWHPKRNKNNGDSHANAMPTQSDGNANQKPDIRIEDSNESSVSEPNGSSPLTLPKIEVQKAIDAYSEMAARCGLPLPRAITPERRKKIAAVLRLHGFDAWTEAIQRMGSSEFCRGQNDRQWRADLDFLLQSKSFMGLLEGKYGGQATVNGGGDEFCPDDDPTTRWHVIRFHNEHDGADPPRADHGGKAGYLIPASWVKAMKLRQAQANG